MITYGCSLLAYSIWPVKTIKGRKKTIFQQFENIYNSYLPYFSSKINSKKKKIRGIFCSFDCEQPQPSIVFRLAARAAKRWPQNTFLLIYWNCMTNEWTGHQFCKQMILPTLGHVLAYPSNRPEMIWYLQRVPYLHSSQYPLKSKICRKRSIFWTWQGCGLNSNFA